MMVAVPAFQHSPMFGHLASSHTVARRCSCTLRRVRAYRSPVAGSALSQRGLPVAGAAAVASGAFGPARMAVKPCGVRYFSPLRAAVPNGAAGSATTWMSLSVLIRLSCSHGGEFSVELRQAPGRADVQPASVMALAAQPAGSARARQPRQQRETAGFGAVEQFRMQHRDA